MLKLLQVESCQVIKSHRHTGHTASSNGYIHTLTMGVTLGFVPFVGWKLVTIVLVVEPKTQLEKTYASHLGSFCQFSGEHQQKYLSCHHL